MDGFGKIPLAFVAVLQLMCIIYNILLLLATLNNRKNNYLTIFGGTATIGHTFPYLNYILVTCLMTINRLVVITKPFTELFTHTRIFIYCGVIAVSVLISLLIPYFSSCNITFMLSRLSFVSGCAPDRHQITTFQNKYTILLPLSCMVINLGIIIHRRLVRDDTYTKIKKLFHKGISEAFGPKPEPSDQSKIRARHDISMMRQTVVIAIYLSIYELGGFITKLFPDEYSSLPENFHIIYFYFRMESIAFMNFLIYYLETPSTRQMLRQYLKLDDKTNVVTVASVSLRTQ